MYAAEFAASVSFGAWYIFGDRTLFGMNVPFTGINVDDTFAKAYEAQYPNLAADHSLHEQWQNMIDRGNESMEGFIRGIKGKVAEFNARDQFNQQGYQLELAENPSQEGFDLHGLDPNGEPIQIQVKTGTSEWQVNDTIEAIRESDYPFALGAELHDRVLEEAPELANRIVADIGPDFEVVEGIADGLSTLSGNLGIDIPDGVVDILPYAGAVIAGARLVYSVLKTEKEFKAADRTARNKIQVVQSLTLMSRMGITTVLAAAGGMGGGALGSIVPGVGNLIGGIAGTLGGAGMGMYLNKHLKPHMISLALNITGMTNDDLFYYKNKVRIDNVAVSYQGQAKALAAPA